MTMLKFGFCYWQAIYTRKQNIDFDLPWFHSHVSNIPKVRESDRQASRQPIVFFFLFMRVCSMFSRELSKRQWNLCVFITLSIPVHRRCLLSIHIHMNIYQCTTFILFTCDLKITFFRSSYMNMALISLKHWFHLLSFSIVFDHRIVDAYIDSSLLSLSYFCACVVKAITIIPD